MKALLIALLVAGMAVAGTYSMFVAPNEERADWEVRIFGAPNGFYVMYYGFERFEVDETGIGMLGADMKVYVFRVASLAEVLPTPDAMRAAGKEEEK